MPESIRFTLNRKPTTLSVDTDRKLLWVLRTDLGLTGTKFGCGESYCGACTVLVGGEPVRSCQTTMKEVQGKEVLTIEGLADGGTLHALQQAFIEHDAMQCGFCTSGMIMNAYGLLTRSPHLSATEVVRGMDDNLCRCGAYKRILEAIADASAGVKGGK